MGRRVGLLILLAASAMLFAVALAQDNNPDYWIKEGYKLKWKGSIEESNKSFENALKIYDNITDSNPGDIKAWENKSSTLLTMGRIEEAISTMDRAIEENPDNPDAWNSKGFTLITIAASTSDPGASDSRYNESLQAFNRALAMNPANEKAWRGMGVVYSDLGNFSEALRCFDRATELDPLFGQAWRSKGILLLEMGRPSEAILALDAALKIEPDDIDAMTMKAQALTALGRYDEAEAIFERAMRIDPAEPQPSQAAAAQPAIASQSGGNSSVPLALGGSSDAAKAIFENKDMPRDEELWI